MKGIADLSKKLKVQIIHNFTEPNQGKFTHDANGSVTKRAVRDAIQSGALQLALTTDETTFSNKIATFLNEHFKESNECQHKMKRTITSLTFLDYVKPVFEYHPIKGIKSFYSFRTDKYNNGIIYHRRNVCYCDNCILCTPDGFSRCVNGTSRGNWMRHTFKAFDNAINLSYRPEQSQNNISEDDNEMNVNHNETHKMPSKCS